MLRATLLTCLYLVAAGRPRDVDKINDKVRVEGMPLFQGDIVMDENMVARILEDAEVTPKEKERIGRLWHMHNRRARRGSAARRRNPRAAIKSEYRMWGDGSQVEFEGGSAFAVIPFTFGRAVPEWKRRKIREAMTHWENKTRLEGHDEYCVKFVPRSKQDNYLHYVNSDGCWSRVGKTSDAEGQAVSLGPSCGSTGLVAHELGHALGFFHEQSRPDRDSWIRILEENVRPMRTYNFIKYKDWLIDPRDVTYDYGSIMHYALDAFTRKRGLDTIEAIQEVPEGVEIGQREGVSEKDAEQIRRMYGCVEPEPTVPPTTSSPPALDEIVVVSEKVPAGFWSWDWKVGQWVWNEG